jgi:hypothetical protein
VAARTQVYVETGSKRVFASAVDWPGWCRSGRDATSALEALRAAAPRYAVVVKKAGLALPVSASRSFEVVERLAGSASTDFGVPGAIAVGEQGRLTAKQAQRLADLMAAGWAILDEVVAGAPASLRKGPRGGGRDRDAIADHVLAAENAYARKIGLRLAQPPLGDHRRISAFRRQMADVLRQPSDGSPITEKGWPPRYAFRRITWHAVDHAWEIEDRSAPAT